MKQMPINQVPISSPPFGQTQQLINVQAPYYVPQLIQYIQQPIQIAIKQTTQVIQPVGKQTKVPFNKSSQNEQIISSFNKCVEEIQTQNNDKNVLKDHQESIIKENSIWNKYKITEKIRIGSFREVFKGICHKTNKNVAFKLEPVNIKRPQLFYEGKLYQYLQQESSAEGKIPKTYYCATEGEYNIMVMDLLGPSLEDLFNKCGRKFSLKTVLMLADVLIERIEYIHSRNFLHSDIEPNNFLIGVGENISQIYLIDFGLSKRYIQKDGIHIPYKEGKSLVGTKRFASINNLQGKEYGRKDDLESLGYLMIYFLRGSLPWQDKKANNVYRVTKEYEVSLRTTISIEEYPEEFTKYLMYVKNLRFDETPDYKYLKTLFSDCFIRNGFESDNIYDWNISSETEVTIEQK